MRHENILYQAKYTKYKYTTHLNVIQKQETQCKSAIYTTKKWMSNNV